MENWITNFMERFGYIGTFLMILIENIFPPIPSEVILTFGGFMTTNTSMNIPGVILFATAGSVLGAILLYGIGRLVNVKRLEKIIERWGYILRLKVEDIEKANAWFNRHGNGAVFICRMVPLMRSLISIPAGMSGMNFSIFLIYTLVGTLIWNTVLVVAGSILGESWGKIVEFMDVYSNITYVILGLAGIAVVALWIVKKKPFRKES